MALRSFCQICKFSCRRYVLFFLFSAYFSLTDWTVSKICKNFVFEIETEHNDCLKLDICRDKDSSHLLAAKSDTYKLVCSTHFISIYESRQTQNESKAKISFLICH